MGYAIIWNTLYISRQCETNSFFPFQMLDQADRARKMAEQELSDTNETLADLTVQNQSLTSAKRKLEQDLADLRQEADEAHGEVI